MGPLGKGKELTIGREGTSEMHMGDVYWTRYELGRWPWRLTCNLEMGMGSLLTLMVK